MTKRIKRYFKSIPRRFVLNSAVMLFSFLAFSFLFVSEYTFSQEAASESYNQSETVYSFLDCDERGCRPWYDDKDGNRVEAKELFKFYGKDADCADYYTDCESSTNCSDLEVGDCTMKIKNCVYAKDTECRNNFSYGQAGSMELAGNIQVEGNRTYLLGSDEDNMHWLKTGDGDNSKTMGINRETSDVHFGGGLKIADDIQMQSNSEISWGNHPSSDERIEMTSEGLSFVSKGEPTLQVKGRGPGGNTLNFNNLEVNSHADHRRGTDGFIAFSTLKWQEEEIEYTPQDLETPGYPVYFYCDPDLEGFGETGGCE